MEKDRFATEHTRTEWDRSAAEDFRRAIASDTFSEEAFWKSGEKEASTILEYLAGRDVAGWRALEFGCGVGRIMVHLARKVTEVHGVDISEEMIRLGRERLRDVETVHFQATAGSGLPFDDGLFDLVYSARVFQHMPRRAVRAVLPEIARVLKPRGVLLFHLTYPYSPGRLLRAILRHDHGETEARRRRFYTMAEINRLARASGFRPLRNERRGRKDSWHLWEKGS